LEYSTRVLCTAEYGSVRGGLSDSDMTDVGNTTTSVSGVYDTQPRTGLRDRPVVIGFGLIWFGVIYCDFL